MKIALVDTLLGLQNALRGQGHEVLSLAPGGGVFHLPGLLAEHRFTPDLVVQQEQLGQRTFFRGLDELPCPTVFWAIDTHLNLFWQRWYGLLFDAVLTPHVSLFMALPPLLRPPGLGRFAWPGSARAFRPHGERGRSLSFCARIDAHRPVRVWMTELLAPLGLHLEDGLSWPEMMALYDDSRTVPNESIANEVNFRLMEAASSGCLVLSPDVGEDQNALLEPGAECLVYKDGLELFDFAVWAGAKPDKAERMGKAAWRRIRAEHLPQHRATTLTGIGKDLHTGKADGRAGGRSGGRLSGLEAKACFWLTMALWARNEALHLDIPDHAGRGRALAAPLLASDNAFERELGQQVMTQALLLLAEGAGRGRAPETARELTLALVAESERDREHSPLAFLELASACSAAALKQQNFTLAGACYLAWTRSGADRAGKAKSKTPRNPAELCAAWASAFAGRDVLFWSGFRFAPENGILPDSALAWLIYARHREPQNSAINGLCAETLAGRPSFAHLRLGFLAEQTLAEPDNWRVLQDYGLTNLLACRVTTGLAELRDALAGARAAGQERAFMARLTAKSPAARSWQALLS